MPEFTVIAELDKHKKITPIDHPDMSVTGGKLSVEINKLVTTPFSFTLWSESISGNVPVGKVIRLWGMNVDESGFWLNFYAVMPRADHLRPCDVLGDIVSVVGNPSRSITGIDTDLALYLYRSADCSVEGVYLSNAVLTDVEVYCRVLGVKGALMERSQSLTDLNNKYFFDFDTPAFTADFKIGKTVAGSDTVIATESVDLSSSTVYSLKVEIVGSTLKFYRDSFTTPKLTVTDTSFASGYMGVQRHSIDLKYGRILRKTYGTSVQGLKALAILEVENDVIYEGKYAVNVPKLLRNIDKEGRDILSVTWGSFEFNEKSPTNIIMIYGDNQYQRGAIGRQKANAKMVLTPPKTYSEAVALYNQLKSLYSHWLAGKDNFVYQVLGYEWLEPLAVIDFYYGELIEHKTHYDQLKHVPDWELENAIEMWLNRLERAKPNLPIDEYEKHRKKLESILKLGW